MNKLIRADVYNSNKLETLRNQINDYEIVAARNWFNEKISHLMGVS